MSLIWFFPGREREHKEWAEPRTPRLAGAQGTGWPSCQVGVTTLSSPGLSPLEGAQGPSGSSGPAQRHPDCV